MRLIISLFALTMLGGVAAAEPHRGGGHGSQRVQRSHDTHARPAHGGGHSARHARPTYDGHSYRAPHSRPAAVGHRAMHSRPAVVGHGAARHAQRYYDHAHRPPVISEQHTHVTGYVWIAGQWAWDGYEWIWQPGRYEVDPANGYSSGAYYDNY